MYIYIYSPLEDISVCRKPKGLLDILAVFKFSFTCILIYKVLFGF